MVLAYKVMNALRPFPFSVILLVGLSLGWVTGRATGDDETLDGWQKGGVETAAAAAEHMMRASVTRSPKRFVEIRLRGVCDGEVDTQRKYAENLHRTTYTNERGALSVYDLPKRIASAEFDPDEKEVGRLLAIAGVSSYYAEKFVCIEVAGADSKGTEYRTRFVVGTVKGRWFALPRCRSAGPFYEIADMMRLAAIDRGK